MLEKLRLIHVGRLVEEKGTHLILQMVDELFVKGYGDLIELHIYGDGELSQQVTQYADKYNFVYYYGRKLKSDILSQWGQCHYTLMPSLFLETFGLSALDSLSVGVPVIGYRKGGLEQFVLPMHDLTGCSLSEVIITLYRNFSVEDHLQNSQRCLQKFQQFSSVQWLKNFEQYSGLKPGAKILFVSDYIVDMGGIESIILQMQQLLQSAGYEVHLLGKNIPTYGKGRRLDMLLSLNNRKFARDIKDKVVSWNPDLIWWHSVMRYIGVTALKEAQSFDQKQWIMHHDFGLFHPFPSLVHNETQLVSARTYKGYIREGLYTGVMKYLIPLKWRVTREIIGYLGCFDIHFVPSPYMVDHISWYFPHSKIQVLPHFIS